MSITVLHISSAGRSGSTLLGLSLGTRPRVFYAGEVHSLWNDDYNEALCSCGRALPECPVWSAAVKAALEAAGLASLSEARAIRDAGARLDVIAARPFIPRLARGAEAYQRLSGALYASLGASSGARVIVDSSQVIAHTLLTGGIAGIDARVIHLARDPRAVVHSWSRARQWPTRAGSVTLRKGVFVATRSWLTQNLKIIVALGRSTLPRLRMRYEDFAARPAEALDRALRLAGEPGLEGADARAINVRDTHVIKANPVRFHRGPLEIRADDEWRAVLPASTRALVTVMTYPLLRLFGYAARGCQERRK